MSFRAYPEYKPSGFDWLPEVPAHWVDRKIARDIPFVVGWTPPSGKDEYYDGDLPWVTIADMTQMSVEDTKSKISHLAVRDKGAKVVPAGSMLFSFKLSVGKIAFLKIDSYTNEAIAGFLPCGPLDLEYWKYAAPEFIPRYGRENIYGATLLNQELISSVRFFAPARTEQTQIARFLDHETARIDALIEEQQRLIELLKEKRHAVISHAVTKGLDPTVPMKDSGVEWLGEVPAHWAVVAIKWLSPVLRGASPRPIDDPKYFDDLGEYSWVRIADVSASDGTLKETTQTLSALGSSLSVKMEPGEMFLSIAGTVGKPCITEIKACIHDGFVYFPSLSIDNKFLYRIFEVGTCYGGLGKMGTQLNLNTETVGGIQIGVPPDSEVVDILEYIDRQSSAFDSLIGEASNGVSLLQERRSALISAAVTGKIDVRGWQPPASAPTPELVQEAV